MDFFELTKWLIAYFNHVVNFLYWRNTTPKSPKGDLVQH